MTDKLTDKEREAVDRANMLLENDHDATSIAAQLARVLVKMAEKIKKEPSQELINTANTMRVIDAFMRLGSGSQDTPITLIRIAEILEHCAEGNVVRADGTVEPWKEAAERLKQEVAKEKEERDKRPKDPTSPTLEQVIKWRMEAGVFSHLKVAHLVDVAWDWERLYWAHKKLRAGMRVVRMLFPDLWTLDPVGKIVMDGKAKAIKRLDEGDKELVTMYNDAAELCGEVGKTGYDD